MRKFIGIQIGAAPSSSWPPNAGISLLGRLIVDAERLAAEGLNGSTVWFVPLVILRERGADARNRLRELFRIEAG